NLLHTRGMPLPASRHPCLFSVGRAYRQRRSSLSASWPALSILPPRPSRGSLLLSSCPPCSVHRKNPIPSSAVSDRCRQSAHRGAASQVHEAVRCPGTGDVSSRRKIWPSSHSGGQKDPSVPSVHLYASSGASLQSRTDLQRTPGSQGRTDLHTMHPPGPYSQFSSSASDWASSPQTRGSHRLWACRAPQAP